METDDHGQQIRDEEPLDEGDPTHRGQVEAATYEGRTSPKAMRREFVRLIEQATASHLPEGENASICSSLEGSTLNNVMKIPAAPTGSLDSP